MTNAVSSESRRWLVTGGAMADLIRSFDWRQTPLGPIAEWPQSLRTAVDILLGSGHAMQLAWGPERTILYNDAYAPMLGKRHPDALGLPFHDAWPEIWEEIAPLVDRVFAGETVRFADMKLVMTRHGYPEDTWWTFSYAPVRDEEGLVAGLLNVTVDASSTVRAERAERERDEAHARLQESEQRQRFLLKLSDTLRPLADAEGIKKATARLLGEHLNVNRAVYGEVEGDDWVIPGDYEHDIVPLTPGHDPVATYGDWVIDTYRRGELLDFSDSQSDPRFSAAERAALGRFQIVAALGIGLLSDGGLNAIFAIHSATPRVWTEQEAALLTDVAERTWSAVQRARAEAALGESEARLAAAFESVPVGAAVIDPSGKMIAGNAEYRRFLPTGYIPSRDGDGDRRARWQAWQSEGRELDPDDYPGARALRGETVVPGQQMLFTDDDGREIWTQVATAPILDDGGRVAGAVSVISDIDQQKRNADALRQSEDRQAFLLKLSDALRPLSDTDEIRLTAATILGQHLGANRVAYAEHLPEQDAFKVGRNYADGAAEVRGTVSYADYGFDILSGLQAGAIRVQSDIANDPRLADAQKRGLAEASVGASLNVPLVKEGRLVAFLRVNYPAAHDFDSSEIALVTEVAERTWAAVERGKAETALRDSQQRFRALLVAGTYSIYRMSPDWRLMYQLDSDTLAPTSEPIEDWVDKYIPHDDRPVVFAAIDEAIRTRSMFELEHRVMMAGGGIGWVLSRAVPLLGPDGEITEWFGAGSDVTQRRVAVERLRESEEKYRTLFETMDEAYALVEVLKDTAGDWADFGFIEVNPAFTAHTSMPDPVGKTATELLGAPNPRWARMYGQALDTGEAIRFEEREETLGLIFDLNVVALDRQLNRVAVLFTNVTDRKRNERALRDSEERQAFLLTLSDALRPLSDEDQISGTATRLLGEWVGASRAYIVEWPKGADYGEVVHDYAAQGLASLAGRYPVDAFRHAYESLSRGGTWIVEDAASDTAMNDAERHYYLNRGVAAWVDVPLVRGSGLRAALCLVQDAARGWTANEVAMAQETAERCWAAIERARAETALRESEERFREFSENSSEALWIVNSETMQLEYLSPAFERIWGRPRDAVMADLSRWTELVHPADRAAASEAMPRLLAGHAVVADYRIVRPDGDVRWIRDTGFPIREGGVVRRGGGIAQDVTELKRTENALRESEERLRQFGEASQDILWLRDAETLQWVYLTPAFETIYGLSRDRAMTGDDYRNWQDLIVPEDRAHAVAAIGRVGAGEWVTFEYRVRRPSDGAVRWLRNTDFPITDDAGKVVLIGGIGHDFTEVREAESRFRTLIEGIPLLVWRAIDGGEWTWASPQWTEFTGQEAADYVNWGWLKALHPDDRDAAREAWAHAIENGGFQVEYRLKRHDDGYRWFQTRAAAVRDSSGQIVEWLGTSTDVDELRGLQELQKTLLAELQHRVRNILAVTRSIVSRSDDGERDTQQYVQHLQGRISALARTQVLLTRKAGAEVYVEDLIRDELLAQVASDEQFVLAGPDVRLSSKAAEVLTLAIHELATNATKYGAFARQGGRLEVRWTIEERDDQRWLVLDWTERGVSIVDAAPRRRGFGTELVSRRICYELKGYGDFELRPGGLRSRIEFPLVAGDSILQTDRASR